MERNHWNNDLDLILNNPTKAEQCWHSFSCPRKIFIYASVCRFCICFCFKSMNIQAERVPSMLYYVLKSIYNCKLQQSNRNLKTNINKLKRQNMFIFSNNCKWATTYKNMNALYGNENTTIVISIPCTFVQSYILSFCYLSLSTVHDF